MAREVRVGLGIPKIVESHVFVLREEDAVGTHVAVDCSWLGRGRVIVWTCWY